jgi:hypothetical protein
VANAEHSQDETPSAPPPWWWRPVGVLTELTALACLAVAFVPWLWLGEQLLPWSPVLMLVLTVLLVVMRRDRAHAGMAVVGILAAAWPWVYAGWVPEAPEVGDEPSVSVCLWDARAWAGSDSKAVRAALNGSGADVLIALAPSDGELAQVLGKMPEHNYEQVRAMRDASGTAQQWLCLAARRRPPLLQQRLVPETDGGVWAFSVPCGEGALTVVVPVLPDGSRPQGFVRQLPVIDELRRVLAEIEGPLVVSLPRGWEQASPRWQSLVRDAGLAVPLGGMPALETLPRPFGRADCLVAGRGVALSRPLAMSLPEAGRDAVVLRVALTQSLAK